MTLRFAIVTATTLALLPVIGSTAVGASSRGDRVTSRAADEIRIEAKAGEKDGAKFKSRYRERITSTTVRQAFKVQVEGLESNSEAPVSVNGIFVANIIVDGLGRGEFQFSAGDDNPGGEQPLPNGFPRLRAGDTVTVGTMSGVFN